MEPSSTQMLLLTERQLVTVPQEVLREYGDSTEYLDLSRNRISDLLWLYKFVNLKCLILDCNRLRETHLQQITRPLINLKILMLNKNELSDLNQTASILGEIFPNLEYLSLHGNPICPDGLYLTPFSQNICYKYDYYQSRILCSMPLLKFLDHSAVQRHFSGSLPKHSARILTFTPKMLWSSLKSNHASECYRPLPEGPRRHVGYHSGCIRKLSSTECSYNGTESEGNRYISNNDL